MRVVRCSRSGARSDAPHADDIRDPKGTARVRKAKTGKASLPIRGRLRWHPGRRRVAAALVVALLVADNPGESPAQADSPAQAPPPPGLEPDVQNWLKDREPLQIELNNALVAFVQNKLGNAACRRLTNAADRMSALSRAPHARVDELARAGLAKFEQGAAACLAGNLAEGERLVREGLAERTAATEPLDETLDGE